ncbi:sigma 54-interacting transcriptional regulator [Hyunsoonleella sp. SJ7]|uniref:Sigma 54-interacting transcriptional regulator n=1 Tax=Hyunsoonleella aquatilis TaxID=2762758 RepID=A0A923KN00_9FLAO|nr:sigma 54-interacting transcriptional regulator [Hyunsoonleella aquatilis]MBC3759590.1 sigma 54-interacting transcriptional regulator [Hyunsoonleella aquatilis]
MDYISIMAEEVSINLIQFLADIPFFSEVSNKSLKHLCDNVAKETFIKNEVVFEKNTIGQAMYAILEGSVKVHDKSHIYDTLSVGDCFGEYALIDNETRSASVTALEKIKVLKIERDDFLDLLQQDSGFAQGILSVMIKRHRELDTIQERLATSKTELENANSKLSGLINGAMDAIIMFNSSLRVVLTNTSANKLLENDDILQRNVLFFFDENSATIIEKIVKSEDNKEVNRYLPSIVKVIGSNGTETLNEGTISKYGPSDNPFYTLILRNIEDRLIAEDKINLLTKQTEYLEEEIKELTSSYGIIAEDAKMQNTLNLVHQVAKTDATVLIHGETGTGKELVARAIHKESNRNDKPLIRINCGAIPANLIESELFGHKKGAFTGATVDRKGRFLLADKGTIFLDEIGEMPLELQPKLLRVIQEGEFDPVGSSETVKVDVRIIAATHRNLFEFSKEGKFREDLFYRLNVFPISVPALRERGNDICLIAEEMVSQFSKKLNKPIVALSEKDKSLLNSYHWPGNVRELQNLIERAVIISNNGKIDWKSVLPGNSISKNENEKIPTKNILTSKELVNLERENILKALRQTKWKISGKNGAAELLDLPPTTLASRIKALGIERPI